MGLFGEAIGGMDRDVVNQTERGREREKKMDEKKKKVLGGKPFQKCHNDNQQ
jgi:hypothetical protein